MESNLYILLLCESNIRTVVDFRTPKNNNPYMLDKSFMCFAFILTLNKPRHPLARGNLFR